MTEEPLSHLYVIGEGSSGIVKIGRSCRPSVRLGEIQMGNPRRMQLLLVVPEAGQHEDAVHRKFSSRRLGGEWFDFGEDDPVEGVQRMLDEILHADEILRAAELRKQPDPIPVPYRAMSTVTSSRRDACKEAGCDTYGSALVAAVTISSAISAATDWFLRNHPDPAAYLLEQGFAWHCVEEIFGEGLPETSRQRMLAEFDPDRTLARHGVTSPTVTTS